MVNIKIKNAVEPVTLTPQDIAKDSSPEGFYRSLDPAFVSIMKIGEHLFALEGVWDKRPLIRSYADRDTIMRFTHRFVFAGDINITIE